VLFERGGFDLLKPITAIADFDDAKQVVEAYGSAQKQLTKRLKI
jgi:hypothetical protein